MGVWGSGRLSLHPLAAASPVVRLYDIPGASPGERACNMVSRRIRDVYKRQALYAAMPPVTPSTTHFPFSIRPRSPQSSLLSVFFLARRGFLFLGRALFVAAVGDAAALDFLNGAGQRLGVAQVPVSYTHLDVYQRQN